jgi:hypothetical protein
MRTFVFAVIAILWILEPLAALAAPEPELFCGVAHAI